MSEQNQFPIFDGHNDTVLDLHLQDGDTPRTFFQRSKKGHLDLPRAQAGGFAGGFFALFVPSKKSVTMQGSDPKIADAKEDPISYQMGAKVSYKYALRYTMSLLARLFKIESAGKGQVQIVLTVAEVEKCLHENTLASILHFEGAAAIGKNLDSLIAFHRMGLRSLGIVWSRQNRFGTGVPFRFPASPDIGPGLTKAGKALVQMCNKLGIMLDLSHLNEKGFWDVARLSNAPLVATHSNAHALCQSPRNLTDKQLDAIAASGGVVGINYYNGFLREDGDGAAETSLTEIVRHADYIARRIGIDHVALGSDFDGARIPQDLKDAAGLPKLVQALQAGGFDNEAMRKITHENWLRVLTQTWKTTNRA